MKKKTQMLFGKTKSFLMASVFLSCGVATAGPLSRPSNMPHPHLYRHHQLHQASITLNTDTIPEDQADFSQRNCFTPFGLPDDIGDSVVEVVNRLKNHTAVTGSGSIIADSGDVESSDNHIVTAKHVIDNAWEIDIILSDGTFIGKAIPAAQTKAHLIRDQDGGIVGENDLAVLVIDTFASKSAEARYRQIRGLTMAKSRPSSLMEGVFETPGGIQHGTSGAPVLTEDGQIIAVITQSFLGRTFLGLKTVAANGTNEHWFSDKNRFGTIHEQVTLPQKAVAVADPLVEQSVVNSLGLAGVNYTTTSFDGNVIVPGFPNRTCLVYKGHLKTR